MARDRPSPYGQRREFVSVTVARGPSEVSIRASERVSAEIAAWRGTGPRPTVFGAVSAWRGTGPALRPTEIHKVTVARGPVPRDRLGYRRAGACPPRSQHSEGQALALRYSVRFQHGERQARALRPTEIHKVTVARGPSEVSIRASERVSPAIAAWRGTGPRPTANRDS